MAGQDDGGIQFRSACDGRVEVVEFKPQEHAVPVWPDGWIRDAAMMVLHVPAVELQNQLAIADEPLVFTSAVGTLAVEETLIPAAARLNVGDANEWLWIHTNLVTDTRCRRPSIFYSWHELL